MSDRVGNHEDRFSHDAALIKDSVLCVIFIKCVFFVFSRKMSKWHLYIQVTEK